MRDYVLVAAFVFALMATLAAPYAGVFTWVWLSIMNPHREAYGFTYTLPLVMVIAVTTIAAWVFSREPKKLPNCSTVWLLIFLSILMVVSATTGLDSTISLGFLDRTLKTVLLTLTIIALINTPTRVHALVWVIAISLGYYAVKGALFGLATGGANRVWGPELTMIGDNNHFALALNMLLPLLLYLLLYSRRKLVRMAVAGVLLCTVVAILLTFSRGGIITIAGVSMLLVLRSQYRWRGIALALIVAAGLLSSLPDHWHERMETIQSIEDDSSFMGRVYAWQVNWEIAKDRPLTGGGFRAYQNLQIYNRYNLGPPVTHGRAAHSIYFEVLGDMGFLGLIIYLLLALSAFLNLIRAKRFARNDTNKQWIQSLATMIQISMFAFFLGGAALSMAFYDLYFILIGLSVTLYTLAQR